MTVYPLLCIMPLLFMSTIISQWKCSRLASIQTKVELPDDCS